MRPALIAAACLLGLASQAAAIDYSDGSGRVIKLDHPPRRIIAVGPGAMRLVAYLGAADLAVATENIELKYPEGRPYALAYRTVLGRLPVVGEGGPDRVPDYEKIMALAPDVIVACSLDAGFLAALESKTRIPVFNADYGNLGAFDAARFKNTLAALGAMLGKKERAARLAARMDFYSKDLAKRAGRARTRPSVYAGGLGFKGAHGITSTQYGYEPFRLLGLKSAVDTDGSAPLHVFIDREKLLKLDPGLIFVDSGGLGLFARDYAASPGFYRPLKAYAANSFYTTLPYNNYSTNVEILFMNAYFVGKTAYPKEFADVSLEAKAGEILKDFVKRNVYGEIAAEKNYYKRIKFSDGISFEGI